MKFLIWFMCFFVCAVIQVIIKNTGFILGGVPTALLFGLTYWVARSICKRWDQHRAAKKAKAAEVTHVEESVAEQDSAPVHKKQRYCKFCGGAIDSENKQCEKCGKQYFRFRVTKKALLAAAQCLLALALVAVIVFQCVQYKSDISVLTEKVENLDLQLSRKNSDMKYLQTLYSDAESRLEFYDQYVVFVPIGESKFMDENEYHKQSCSHFKKHLLLSIPADFCAMDVETAEYMGYKPCTDCCE